MKEVFNVVSFMLFFVVVLIGLGWLLEGNNFFLYKVFNPQYEQVRNDTFHNSQMYNDGMKTDLAKYKFEYTSTTDQNKKDAICAVVRHDFASYPKNRLDDDLQDFYNTCMN